MSTNCVNTNPLQRSGTSQADRVLQALLPASAPVDDRQYDDLVLFSRKYASFLTYYDRTLHADGDWTPFMKMDISVTIAAIAKERVADYFAYITYLYAQIQGTPATTTADRKKYFTTLMNFLFSLVYHLNESVSALPESFDYTVWLHVTIASRLLIPYAILKAYYDAADQAPFNLIDGSVSWVGEQPPFPVTVYADLQKDPLSKQDWPIPPPNPPVLPATLIEGATTDDQLLHTINHGIFRGAIENFLKGYSALVDKAPGYLDETLNDFPTHSPHYALYLTFLKLFRQSQDHLNQFTDRHLKFYYQDVLRLVTNPAVPDEVYLLFTLQKNIQQHLLKAGTAFKAGKDVRSRDKVYTLLKDIVVNTGVVSSIRSLYCPAATGSNGTFGALQASPIAGSADGQGAALTSPDKSWWAFGNPALASPAGYGFAIAHPLLFMQEGTRYIQVVFRATNPNWWAAMAAPPTQDNFIAELTGLKKWMTVAIAEFGIDGDGNLVFVLFLDPTADAVIPYSEKIHQRGMVLATPLPVLSIRVVDPAAGSGGTGASAGSGTPPANYCEVLANMAFSEIDLLVYVIGLKDVTVLNDIGPQDTSKPFTLFGPQPAVGSAAIIGSNELAYKNITGMDPTGTTAAGITVHIDWDKLTSITDFSRAANKTVNTYMLAGGGWKQAATALPILSEVSYDVRDPNTPTAPPGSAGPYRIGDEEGDQNTEAFIGGSDTLNFALPEYDGLFDFGPNPPYTVNAKNGFLKIEFAGPTDFGHFDYIKRFTTATLNTPSTLPEQPYTPAVKSLTIDYIAFGTVDLDHTVLPDNPAGGYFFHIGPFGSALQSKAILGSTANPTFLPVFPNEGEFFIGIDAFAPDQTLSLLFQLSEGSADPSFDEQTIAWSFLGANNQWIAFDSQSVSDDTGDLTRTGIIRFSFPHTATNLNTWMGASLYWIRAAVAKDTGAICHIISIQAQAAAAQLTDYYHTGVVYTDILPPSTISKLLVGDSAIKSISQPYSSFGGKVAEPDSAFYTRVSERLRHKNRSITMWDYERMVLQQFPEIQKVKCINHTRIGATVTDGDNELAPGYVLVVPIPNLQGKNAIDPLRPQTSLGTLVKIGDYLRGLISPFVKLQVKNARFDEIQLDFKVQFRDGDAAFYAGQLNTEIEQFMSPWAFGGSQEIEFGGKISKSVLLNFVEQRTYVDYVTCFSMYQIVNGVKLDHDLEEAVASSSRSVMVSYKQHQIDYSNPNCNCP